MTTAEQIGVSVLDNLDPEAPRYLEGLVTVRMDSYQASLWNPVALREITENRPGELFRRPDVIRERYVVEVLQTTRNVEDANGEKKLQRNYSVELAFVDQDGLKVRIPWPVIERINSYKDRLQSQALSAAAKERAEERRTAA